MALFVKFICKCPNPHIVFRAGNNPQPPPTPNNQQPTMYETWSIYQQGDLDEHCGPWAFCCVNLSTEKKLHYWDPKILMS